MPNSQHVPVSILLIVFGLACIHICKCSGNHVIGRCDDRHSCSECYQRLVRSLLSKDQNLFNLSKAFFPTNSNDRPQFVTVTYCFKGTNEFKVWYWTGVRKAPFLYTHCKHLSICPYSLARLQHSLQGVLLSPWITNVGTQNTSCNI